MAIWWACRPETPDQSDLIIDLSFFSFLKFLNLSKAKDVPKFILVKKLLRIF